MPEHQFTSPKEIQRVHGELTGPATARPGAHYSQYVSLPDKEKTLQAALDKSQISWQEPRLCSILMTKEWITHFFPCNSIDKTQWSTPSIQ